MSVIFGGRVHDFVKISYSIKVRISQSHRTSGKRIAIAEASRNIIIQPSTEELPPLDVDDENSKSQFYCLRKESTIRRGLVCAKQGRLSFMATQPRSFRLSSEDGVPASTYLRVLLRFDPTNNAALPPRLGILSSKICATTHWATAVRQDFPSTHKKEILDRTKDEWTDSVPLAALSVENVEWTKHDPSALGVDHDHLRPQSVLSSVSGLSGDSACGNRIPAPSATYREGSTFYTSQILLPLSLPQDKGLLPTFHTCLISRVYALKINLSLDKRICSNLELCVPVQVSAAGNEMQMERIRQAEIVAQASTDAEQVFEPRILSSTSTDIVVPEIRLRRTISGPLEEPPDYEVLSYGFIERRRTAVAV
jgi:Bul1 C terminus